MIKVKGDNMKIINKVIDEDYVQWIEKFVIRVLKHAHIKCEEVIIEDIEPSKRIFIFVDGKEYDIRTWNYHPIRYDNNGIVCAERVEYTLFKMVSDEGGSHGEVVDEDFAQIEWVDKL